MFESDAPHADREVFESQIPIMGICYGQQEIAWSMGGEVLPCSNSRGYGHSMVTRSSMDDGNMSQLHNLDILKDLPEEFQAWMSHGDHLSKIPPEFCTMATAPSAPHAVIGDSRRRIYGMQFHPEVTHTPMGTKILKNFVLDICECKPSWTMQSFLEKEIIRIQALVGPTAHVVGAVSGGVDSTIAAVLVHRAIGDR